MSRFYSTFPLFQSHLDLAHQYWTQLVAKGDDVLDATCGNGYDTLTLAELALAPGSGRLWAIDIQQQALDNTWKALQAKLTAEQLARTKLYCQSHAKFPAEIAEESIKLITYNLGYLPGGQKSLTTCTSSTLSSLQAALKLVQAGGAISIACYPGHAEGAKEEQAITQAIQTLDPRHWNCTMHSWPNRNRSPSLILIQKTNRLQPLSD